MEPQQGFNTWLLVPSSEKKKKKAFQNKRKQNSWNIYPVYVFTPRLDQSAGPLPGSWTYHNNQEDQTRKDQLSVSGGNKVTVVMSKSSDRLSPMMREMRSKFKKSQSIDEIDIGSYKVYR